MAVVAPEREAGACGVSALIPIREHEGRQAVSGRDLHAFLGLGRDYTTWFKTMVEYGFVEGDDYLPTSGEVAREGRGSVIRTDHVLTLDMAKELAMIQRTPRGQEARRYFIEVEKRARAVAVPQSLPDALRAYAVEVEQRLALEAKVRDDAPKVHFAEAVALSPSTILIGELAKIIKGRGVEGMGQNRLFAWMRDNGYLIRRSGSDWNMPTQRSMELGLFRIKESTHQSSDGSVRITKTVKVTGKGQQYFVDRLVPRREVAA